MGIEEDKRQRELERQLETDGVPRGDRVWKFFTEYDYRDRFRFGHTGFHRALLYRFRLSPSALFSFFFFPIDPDPVDLNF